MNLSRADHHLRPHDLSQDGQWLPPLMSAMEKTAIQMAIIILRLRLLTRPSLSEKMSLKCECFVTFRARVVEWTISPVLHPGQNSEVALPALRISGGRMCGGEYPLV